MKRTPPRSRLLWIQPARRTVWPAWEARRSLQVWVRYGLGMGLFPRDRDFARAGEVENAKGLHEQDERRHLRFVAGDLDGEVLRLHVDDLGAEDVANLHHLGAGLRVDLDLEQDQFTVNIFAFMKILHLDHINELVELARDLIEHTVITHDDD